MRILWLAVLGTLLFPVHSVIIRVENLPEKCDFSKCTTPDPKKLNVHLVPHTHDDVGWLKTLDQYYYGQKSTIQKAGVQYILDSVVEQLIRDKNRRFIYVETAFFWKWWLEQDEAMRAVVQELVKTGQLEFINGGWTMNDEAATHYNSIIDQMTWGHRRLNDTFGRCGIPRVAWQIDPFGHSREQANLFAGMNFDALFFWRFDYQDKVKRTAERTLEHVWQGSDDRGRAGDLFTGILHMGYGPPAHFNWDLAAQNGPDEPVIDNHDSEEYNVPEMVAKFVNSSKVYAKYYATNQILFPMGTDFQYQAAGIYYKNMDKLIHHVNAISKDVHVFYSTPSCYTKALYDSGRTWTAKNDDFFPYANAIHSYWTGYFTSRPSVKRFERVGNQILQSCKQVDVLAANGQKYEKNVTRLREMMGVIQHHDAITGTEKQNVTFDYVKNLDLAVDDCISVIHSSYQSRLLPKVTSMSAPPILKQHYCRQLNESACPITESGHDFIVQLYNPLGVEVRNKLIRLPVDVSGHFYTVTGPKGELLEAVLVPIPEYVQHIPGRRSKATYELLFRVNLPPLGLASYFVTVTKTRTSHSAADAKKTKISRDTILRGHNITLRLDGSGAMAAVELADGRVVSLKSSFRYYRGHTGNNIPDTHRASGAYVFRPTDDQKTVPVGAIREGTLFQSLAGEGAVSLGVQEVHQRFDGFASQVVRLDAISDTIELDWIVGPIPIEDGVGKEIVARVETGLKNGKTFWTDANGRQMMKRVVNYRPTWKLEVNEPISGNYYPINTRIALQDEAQKLQMTLLTDRSQGGAVLEEGVFEVMLHRRLLLDDAFGVDEALNETGVDGRGLIIRGKHVLQLANIKEAARLHRPLAQQMVLEPVISFVTDIDPTKYQEHFRTVASGLRQPLPANVHLLTLEQWSADRLLLRLEHFYQKDEDAELSKPVTVSLQGLFTFFEIIEAQELTLSANADVSALKNRLQFKYTPVGGAAAAEEHSDEPLDPVKLEVKLGPMQIRTFAVKVKWY